MKEIERRAMLGDEEAQRECTQQGIVLPCPICYKPVKVSVSKMLYACTSCHVMVSFNSFNVNPEDTLRIWNTRPAPPIGRCKDCRYFGGVFEKQGSCSCEKMEVQDGAGVYPFETDYCSYFEPKEDNT